MISTILRRLGKGKSPFHADRTHLHHLLMRGGLSQRRALVSILLIATAMALIGIFLERVWPQNEAVSFGLWLMILGLYVKIITNQAPNFAKRFSKLEWCEDLMHTTYISLPNNQRKSESIYRARDFFVSNNDTEEYRRGDKLSLLEINGRISNTD